MSQTQNLVRKFIIVNTIHTNTLILYQTFRSSLWILFSVNKSWLTEGEKHYLRWMHHNSSLTSHRSKVKIWMYECH